MDRVIGYIPGHGQPTPQPGANRPVTAVETKGGELTAKDVKAAGKASQAAQEAKPGAPGK